MDYRCPACGRDLGTRRWTEPVVARMEAECPHCKNVIRLNIHPAEVVMVTLIFGAILVLAGLGYWLQNRVLVLSFFGVAMVGAMAIPVLERIYLRSWPRYAAK